MDRQVNKLLQDILEAANSIDSFIAGFKLSDYQKTKLVRRAVERELTIIGEAMNNLLKLERDIPITAGRKIISFRNLVTHAYDSVNDETTWVIITKHLPVLKSEVEPLLKQE
jgi:uncharacterized protein with HEPN domain